MSEAKTKPTDASVFEFLEAAATDRRRTEGHQLAEILTDVTGTDPVMWGPTIVGYGSFHYVSPSSGKSLGDWPKVAFSPRKAQLTFYGLKDLPEGAALLPSLGTYTEGAGCVYVKKLEDIEVGVLRELIAIAWSRTDAPVPA